MPVQRIGTAGADTFEVGAGDIAGSTFSGGAGFDTLQLIATTHSRFDFQAVGTLSGMEQIRGTRFTDYISLNMDQLSQITTFDSGPVSGGALEYKDIVELYGQAIDFRNKTLIGYHELQVMEDGAEITLNNKAHALLVDGTEASGERLRLVGVTLNAAERLAIHKAGIDYVTDDSNVTSSDLAPTLAGIAGDILAVAGGQAVRLDIGAAATISEDRALKSLRVSLDSWSDTKDRLYIDPSATNIQLVPGTFGDAVYVNTIEIGTVRQSDTFNTLDFSFNDKATPALAQELVRALVYRYDGAALPYGSNKVEIEVLDQGNRAATASFVLQHANLKPTDITAEGAFSVAENAQSWARVAVLEGQDPNADDRLTLSLVDDAGGLFDIDSFGNLEVAFGARLDYETARSHQVTVRATDRGGLWIDKVFTIAVTDIEDGGRTGPGGNPTTTIMGTNGVDVLRGSAADERILGLSGNDTLYGEGGVDAVSGGLGRDVLWGGAGRDVFIFDSKVAARRNTNVDKIKDFKVVDDTVSLSKGIFKALGKKQSTLGKDAFWAGSEAHDANDRVVYNKKTGALFYDADGTGSAAAIQIATLTKNLKMTHKDFFVI
ncbi:MAG TPA: hypothetical protein VIL09_15255 [Microvirga sp.]|jgi:Ca2+-binding RTX toxin-like protein